MSRDPRIDAYIEKARPFARPVLLHLRELVHVVVPDAEETVKWGMPHFTYKGKNVAGMAAFKAHCAFIVHGDGRQDAGQKDGEGMGGYGKIADLADLPDDAALAAALKDAMASIDIRGTAQRPGRHETPPCRVRGSRASRTASPSRFRAITSTSTPSTGAKR